MKTNVLAAGAALAMTMGLVAGGASAHHSFAMFDSSQHRLIEGTVTEWNYNNPHSWLIVEAPGADGAPTTWSFEGAAIVHAARQGVNGKSYAKGEKVRIVMHPLRDGRNAGALAGEGLARVGQAPRHAPHRGLTEFSAFSPVTAVAERPAGMLSWLALGLLPGSILR